MYGAHRVWKGGGGQIATLKHRIVLYVDGLYWVVLCGSRRVVHCHVVLHCFVLMQGGQRDWHLAVLGSNAYCGFSVCVCVALCCVALCVYV